MSNYYYRNYPVYPDYPNYPSYPNYHGLVELYPDTYWAIQPVVDREINNLRMAYGPNYVPSREVYDDMVERCYREVEPTVYNILRNDWHKIKEQ